MYMNFYISAPRPPRLEIWGRNVQGAKRPVGAKRPGGETTRGGNGLGAKRPGTDKNMFSYGSIFRTKKIFFEFPGV